MFRKSLEIAETGDNIGVLVKNIKKDEVKRGYVLAMPGFIKVFKSFKGKIYVLTAEEGGRKKPFLSNFKPQFFFRTANMTGTVILPEGVSIAMPGDSLEIQVDLIDLAPLSVGLRFIIRESNLTIGAGVIVDLLF